MVGWAGGGGWDWAAGWGVVGDAERGRRGEGGAGGGGG